ncbi:MAG: bifunctional heptose 7-phosphate kinase/heptose 1-phosphate adenyltransferase [Oscillospiraceae bacterium]
MEGISAFSLSEKRMNELLQKLPKARLGLIGDVCLDMYWFADMRRSELSRETPHFPLPVVEERLSLGAAGNVAANIKALGVETLHLISAAGDDWRHSILSGLLKQHGLREDYIVECKNRVTQSYCKPMRKGISEVVYEDPRIDFSNYEPLPAQKEDEIIDALGTIAEKVDVLAVSDQFMYGCVTPRVRQKICEIGERLPVVVDSRDRISEYTSVIIKPNEIEAGALLGQNLLSGDLAANLLSAAPVLSGKTGRPVVITLGEKGAFYYQEGSAYIVPAQAVSPPIDFVGAGDTFLSAFCATLAVGATGPEAIAFGNLASAVVIKKIGITGVATPEEIRTSHRQREE